jgi:hypothetical protein
MDKEEGVKVRTRNMQTQMMEDLHLRGKQPFLLKVMALILAQATQKQKSLLMTVENSCPML